MGHKTVAEIVVETLQSAGFEHCWGVPGDTLNYVPDPSGAVRSNGSTCAMRRSAASRPALKRS
jgi:hypothetical protein